MNIIIYTVVILVIFYLLLRFIANISSKKLSKGLRILIVIGLIILAFLFAIGGKFLLTLPLTLASLALCGMLCFQVIATKSTTTVPPNADDPRKNTYDRVNSRLVGGS